MTKSPVSIPEKYLSQLHYNGLNGRMLKLPGKGTKTKKILLLGGQHTSIDRMYAVAQYLNDYGEIIMPDLPGFGGMTSFFDVGMEYSYDNYADYLYTFMKTNKLTNDMTIVANSLSSQYMTRMFQKHPDSQDWVSSPIAFVGFAGGSNFHIKPVFKGFIWFISIIMASKWGSRIVKLLVFNPVSIHAMLFVFSKFKAKMQADNDNLRKDMIQMEKHLWIDNDLRTHATSAIKMLKSDLTKYSDKKIKRTLKNIITEKDQYFDNTIVKADFEKMYTAYEEHPLDSHVHAPSMIASKDDVAGMMPPDIAELLK